ncbi:uncharacterized protein [Euphorbia lathyris]|uniref:uncharacterized protein n=1 Tax=Euphorbia lathyris TaxID=212925 RepID=UPI003313B81B
MESVKKRKKYKRRLCPVLKPHRPILNDYSDEDTISPTSQQLPTLGANQEGWRQISREKKVQSAANINEATRNATARTPSSVASMNDLRNKRITTSSPRTRATFDDEGLHSSLSRSTLDKMRRTIINNADNENVDETDACHLQGSDHPQSDNPIDNHESDYPCLSDTEISAENSETFRARSVGRGPYKGMELDKLTNGRKNKLVVFIPPGRYFRPIGKHSNKLSSWLGYCARIYRPPTESWDEIEKKHRSRLWAMIQDYFDVSTDSPEKWKKREELGKEEPDTPEMKKAKFEYFCFFQMKTAYRRWKYKLHNQYRMYSNDEERLKHVPKELSGDAWKDMLKVFGSEDFQEQSYINSTNRASQIVVSSTGLTPFAQVEYKMMDEELGELPKASDVWKATHGITNDQGQTTFHDSQSKRIYEDMQRVEDQPINDNQSVPTSDHVLQQVFGVRSGYVRGKGLGYKAITRGMMSNGKNDEVNALKNEVARLTAELKAHEGHRKAQDEHEVERQQVSESYCRRMEIMLKENSSRSTQNALEEEMQMDF